MAHITASLSPIPAPPPPQQVILRLELSKQEASWLLDLTRHVGGVGPVRRFTDEITCALQNVNAPTFCRGEGPFGFGHLSVRDGFRT